MSEPVVRLQNVSRTFEQGRVVALDHCDLEIARGEFVAITGPSGSGKTTLLNLIGAMDSPSSGTVYIDGEPLTESRTRDRVRAHKVGFIFQMHNLIPVLSAQQNVTIPLIPHRIARSERQARARKLLAEVGLGHRADANVRVLSGGERQRIAIARALVNEPALLLADEPTGNLDSQTGLDVMETLQSLRRRTEAALVLVTHNQAICAGADRRFEMRDGRLTGP